MISIILATHNGASTLGLTLEAFRKLEAPEGGYEIIVVDNNSSDNTAEIAEGYRESLPLTIIAEPTPGKTHALNRGIGVARGDLLLFTDDDVIPVPDWLKAYEAAARHYPDCSVFAGQVRHFWQKEPPRWLVTLGEKGMAYGGTPVDRQEGDIPPVLVKGANFMLRSQLLPEYRFGSGIGPDGSRNYAAGAETEFLVRLSAAGYRMIYIPGAVLQHIVRPYQVSLEAVLVRYFRIGRGLQATGAHPLPENAKTLFGYPRYMARILVKEAAAAAAPALRGDSARAVEILMETAMDVGRTYEWRRHQMKKSSAE